MSSVAYPFASRRRAGLLTRTALSGALLLSGGQAIAQAAVPNAP